MAHTTPAYADVLALATRWRAIIARFYGWEIDPGDELTPEYLATYVLVTHTWSELGDPVTTIKLVDLHDYAHSLVYASTWEDFLKLFGDIERGVST